jgi:hypothetical protein
MDLSTIFAWIVTVLAGLAVLGALVFVIVWEVRATHRTLAAYRVWRQQRAAWTRFNPSTRYWREHSATTVPERRP